MIQIDLSLIPKELEKIKPTILNPVLKKLKKGIIEQINNPINQDNFNLQRSLKCLLLLTYFLLEDKTNFEIYLKDIRAKALKTKEKEQLYFDLLLLQLGQSTPSSREILNKLGYDKLVGAYVKWNLLFYNLLKIKYGSQIKHLEKADWKATPNKYLTLLEIMIDCLYRLPAKADFLRAIETKLNHANKNLHHFWDLRNIDFFSIKTAQSRVKVVVWDTGVDKSSIKNISSNLFLGYDENCEPTEEPMMPLVDIKEKEWKLYKGYLDLKSAKKSNAAKYFLQELSQYKEEDMIRIKAIINQLTVYCHGTVVASVVSQRNPNIEIVPIRISFDTNMVFPTLYTAKRVENEIKMHKLVFDWLKLHKISIVNISWNYSLREFDTSLLNSGITNNNKRTTLAKKLFTDLKKSLYNGIKNCKNTLFVIGAGNSNSLVEEEGFIPSSFTLPNIISTGAVNYNGDRTSFTSIGKNVQIYANGSYVNTTIPYGYKIQSSGTSIAAPQVCNLAATMLSICPKLSIMTLKKIILENADKMPEEEIFVLNPKKTVEKVITLI